MVFEIHAANEQVDSSDQSEWERDEARPILEKEMESGLINKNRPKMF